MRPILIGLFSGALSGIAMGVISHFLFRLGFFKASLIVIDGSFLFRTLKRQGSPSLVAGAGLVIHLVTSAVFGALYFVAVELLGLTVEAAASAPLTGLYIALLWLSMLFIALPVAGEGFLGMKSGPLSWFEQLILHIIFFTLYYLLVRALL